LYVTTASPLPLCRRVVPFAVSNPFTPWRANYRSMIVVSRLRPTDCRGDVIVRLDPVIGRD